MTHVATIDALVNAIGMAGVIALIVALRRRDASGPMRCRWTLALGLVAAMYLCRGLAWLGAGRGFELANALAATGIPIAVLLVVEGLMRRHAPFLVKLAISTGTIVVAVAIVAAARFGPALATIILGAHIGLGLTLATVTATLGMRGLDPAERRMIAALVACQILLIPAALSDFRDFFPGTPARLSPLAVMVLGWVGLTIGAWRVPERLAWLALLAGVSALAGFGLAATGTGASGMQIAIVLLSALMLVTICGEAMARADDGLALRRALTAARPDDRDALLLALTSSATVGGGAILAGPALDAVEPEALRAFAEANPVLRRRDAPWGRGPTDIAAEGLVALFEAHNATHLLVINRDPLALLAVNLPPLAADEAAETDLALVQRLIALTPRKVAA